MDCKKSAASITVSSAVFCVKQKTPALSKVQLFCNIFKSEMQKTIFVKPSSVLFYTKNHLPSTLADYITVQYTDVFHGLTVSIFEDRRKLRDRGWRAPADHIFAGENALPESPPTANNCVTTAFDNAERALHAKGM